ncbi:hypothetical protein ACO0RG_000742 [Hanseniaspora osmophila]|uniref:Sorting nexin-4 n=1 Tax=Hanseniaspora osmophila TaxID=56408 RepID=A0A1E5R2P1_9ASCO|nr:Sorting nexin-4 [Hanseniaspora osmophila]
MANISGRGFSDNEELLNDANHDTKISGVTAGLNKTAYEDFFLDVMVSDPQRQRDEHAAFVNYQVSTKTDKKSYHHVYRESNSTNTDTLQKKKSNSSSKAKQDKNEILVVHRRYSDFLLLHNILMNDYPCSIIPPIPDKKVLQYFAGDRFSPSFTQKRCHSLQNFLQKLALHPVYKNSKILETFLTNSTEWEIYRRTINISNAEGSSGKSHAGNGGNSSNKEDVSDYFINAFKHVHHQSDEFIEIKEKSEKLDYNIKKIDKVTHRVVKLQDGLIEDYGKFSKGIDNFRELLMKNEFSSGCADNNSADENMSISVDHSKLVESLAVLNSGLVTMQYALKDLTKYYDFEYLTDLRDMEHYIDNLKHLVKLKDQKQIDYEELNDYLTKSITEKNNLISGYTGNFFTNKLEEIAGINQEQSRREKISKLDGKIETLTEEVETAKKTSLDFEKQTLKEIEIFENIKTQSLKKSLTGLADNQIEFYEKLYETWSKVEEGV